MRLQILPLLAIVSTVVVTAASGATPPPAPSLYLSPTGSDGASCTREQPCATFQRAYLAARPGQVVELAGGTYNGIQEIPLDPKKTSTSDVVFRPAAGAVALLPNGIDVYGRHVTLQRLTIGTVLYVKCGAEDVTLRGSKAAAFFIRPARGVSLINDEFGPVANVSSTIGPSGDCPQAPSGVLLDHVYMHDVHTDPHNSMHIECLQVNLVDGLTIRNSRFHHCEDFDILLKRDFGDINISNVTLENNWFDVPYPDGSTAVAFSDPANASYKNVLIRNNSFNASLIPVSGRGVVFANFRIMGNVGTSIGDSCRVPGVTRSYNVWANSTTCNSTEKRAPTRYANADGFNFHLLRGAMAINRGNPKSYPQRDIDGQRRPIGKRPDAGADESLFGKPKPKPKPKGKRVP